MNKPFTPLILPLALCLVMICASCAISTPQPAVPRIAPKPLYTDPGYDGAADPTVMWNPREKKWFMFYTNRRATATDARGVEWVHGTPIGIAQSADGGVTWTYRTDCKFDFTGLDVPEKLTHWAPDVYEHDGTWYMFLTLVPGIFDNWSHPREIVQLSSTDLIHWKYMSTLSLNTKKVIDADVVARPGGGWRLFYNDEPDGKSIYYADSDDLVHWTDKGKAIFGSRGEGPVAFQWNGHWWMLVDAWKGLAVYRSDDLLNWELQPDRLLEQPGTGNEDGVMGNHPDVVVNNGRAYVFYFTHPGRTPGTRGVDSQATRRSVIQVAELQYADGWLTCDRNAPTEINLVPPVR